MISISIILFTILNFQKENVDEDILLTGHGPHAVEIDLMMPLDPNKAPKVTLNSQT